MSKCIVKLCKNTTRKNLSSRGIRMYDFPSDLQKIKHWLLLIGQNFGNLDSFAHRILRARRSFRICSDHFTPDCYVLRDNRPILHDEAVPSIFPKIIDDSDLCMEDASPPSKRPRFDPVSQDYQTLLEAYNRQLLAPPESKYKVASTTTTVTCKDVSTRTDIYYQTREVGTRTIPFQGMRAKKTSTDPKWGKKNASTETSHAWLLPPSDRYVKMVDAATCTEPEFRNPSVAEPWKIRHDHMYPTDDSRSTEDSRSYDSSDNESYVAPKDKKNADRLVNERKFLVFESCLDELLQHLKCSYGDGCKASVSGIEKHVTGTMLTVVGYCSGGHICCLWQSQPVKGRTGIGDLICSSAVLFSGGNFQKVHEMFTFMGLPFVSPSRYSVLQRKYMFPIIDFYWFKEQQRSQSYLRGHPVSLVGDGRFGSFGHNGKYCTYTFLESTTKRILDFHIGQSTRLTSAMTLEKFAYKNSLDSLLDEGFSIETVSTDKRVALHNFMEERYEDISYKYDLWKYCKRFRKKLMAASLKSGCAKIAEWIPDLTNHLRFSTGSSRGQEQLTLEKWLSYLHHITGQHSWADLKQFNSCAHPPLTAEENDRPPWLCQKDPAYQHVKEIMTDQTLLGDLSRITALCHKGQLDFFHSLVLKYIPERTRFQSDALEARTKLAVLAHNYNSQRVQLAVRCRIHRRSRVSKHRNKMSQNKQKHWVAKYVYGSSASAHVFPIISDVIRFANKQIFRSWRSHPMSSCVT
ncbi:uncharacterized protein LOC142656917 [Rhinoderma darwinii]|uniref:uncharacterized protein LOC142656917 n=1 Tax=Rhinoderma darwinii TaxID=43563 RepID=UPI003F673FB3